MSCPVGYVCHQYHVIPPGFFIVLAIGCIVTVPLGWLLGKFIIWRDDRKGAKRAASGIDARSGETEGLDPKGESQVANGETPKA